MQFQIRVVIGQREAPTPDRYVSNLGAMCGYIFLSLVLPEINLKVSQRKLLYAIQVMTSTLSLDLFTSFV